MTDYHEGQAEICVKSLVQRTWKESIAQQARTLGGQSMCILTEVAYPKHARSTIEPDLVGGSVALDELLAGSRTSVGHDVDYYRWLCWRLGQHVGGQTQGIDDSHREGAERQHR